MFSLIYIFAFIFSLYFGTLASRVSFWSGIKFFFSVAMSLFCNSDPCRDKNSSSAVINCWGLCLGKFHVKCIDLTASIVKKLSAKNSGSLWLCPLCRNHEAQIFQQKLDVVSSDLLDLTSKCEKVFQNLRSMKTSISFLKSASNSMMPNNNSTDVKSISSNTSVRQLSAYYPC